MNREFGKNEQGPGSSELIENAVLRETENEIINQIAAKVK